MEHESDSDTNSNQYIGTEIEWLGNKRTSGDHPNYAIITMGQNTK